ncbi:hypothetical protein [Pararobbsia alpina]|uniref:Uncharacterized protein n=1 Tax=Pararobbsia alpina TaxID=621374 RepID=A0A6S7BKY1_9BURK|nr:hypothetical protein [Pararobbsia alpina]CAB3794790.1 hypothetical protein LMG28138_03746 [Pararobbsia alpina]
MRSTRATYAVERLKTRSGNPGYAAVSLSGGLFYLIDRGADKGADTRADTRVGAANVDTGAQQIAGQPGARSPAKLCGPLPLDAFVAFVDGLGPPKPSKASKLDLAFEEQLRKSRS